MHSGSPIASRPVRRTRYHRVRLYESLRTAHLERARQQVPASILFRTRRYDFDDALAEGLDLHEVALPSMLGSLLRSQVTVLEVNEPLMRSGLLRSALAIAAVRVAARLRNRRATVVSYAIENLDPFAGPAPTRLRGRVRRRAERALSRHVAARLDRLAFGTEAAERLYLEVLAGPLAGTRTTVVPALPAAVIAPTPRAVRTACSSWVPSTSARGFRSCSMPGPKWCVRTRPRG